MKYKCEMVQDLMPLCIDESATEASKAVVVQHLAECKACTTYYEELNKKVCVDKDTNQLESRYATLAKKIRRRRLIGRFVRATIVGIVYFCLVNYAMGYRLRPQKAADLSGRLNYQSEVIGSYEWNNMIFYFYDSYSCYDVIGVKKTWHGWINEDSCLTWPKFYTQKDGDYVQEGIQFAGTLCYCSYEGGAVQLIPFIVLDEAVKQVEISCFGETKTMEPEVGEFSIITFEPSGEIQRNEFTGTAYDAGGNPLYTIGDEFGYSMWIPVEE